MTNHKFYWLAIDVLIFFALIFLFDVKRHFVYVLFLIFQIALHFLTLSLESHLSKGFCDAHRIDFKNPQWWVFVFWFALATFFEWSSMR